MTASLLLKYIARLLPSCVSGSAERSKTYFASGVGDGTVVPVMSEDTTDEVVCAVSVCTELLEAGVQEQRNTAVPMAKINPGMILRATDCLFINVSPPVYSVNFCFYLPESLPNITI